MTKNFGFEFRHYNRPEGDDAWQPDAKGRTFANERVAAEAAARFKDIMAGVGGTVQTRVVAR
jgi:hypothetical protein